MDTSDIQGKYEQPQAWSTQSYCCKIVVENCYKARQLFLLKIRAILLQSRVDVTKQDNYYKTRCNNFNIFMTLQFLSRCEFFFH